MKNTDKTPYIIEVISVVIAFPCALKITKGLPLFDRILATIAYSVLIGFGFLLFLGALSSIVESVQTENFLKKANEFFKEGRAKEIIQKTIIMVYFALVTVACVYVPWRIGYPTIDSKTTISLGYALLWNPTTEPKYSILSQFLIIDYGKIALELIIITAIFAILFVLTLRPKRTDF